MSKRVIDPYDPVLCWQEWTDILGNKVHPDDFVAYASIKGKSPQMVIAKVVRINRYYSNGDEIVSMKWPNGRGTTPTTTPSASYTVTPVMDARGFWRGTDWKNKTKPGEIHKNARPVTLHIPNNVIRVDWKPEEE